MTTINYLTNDLDKGNNFIDYCITIGLKEETIFSDFLYKNDLDTLNESPLTKPDITPKFPPIDKTIIGIDESLIKVYSINSALLP